MKIPAIFTDKHNQVAIGVVNRSLKLTIPTNFPNEIQSILNQCFESNPNSRPTCQQILEKLKL